MQMHSLALAGMRCTRWVTVTTLVVTVTTLAVTGTGPLNLTSASSLLQCFDSHVTYGLAVKGLLVNGTVPVSLAVDITKEPDVRQYQKATAVHGTITVSGLMSGKTYSIFRYANTEAVPEGPPFANKAEATHTFVASNGTYTYQDPKTFSSHSATYYLAAPGK